MFWLSLQCFDTVGWATGQVSGLYKVWCWFVYGKDLTGALHVSQLQLQRHFLMQLNRLTQAHLEKWPLKWRNRD